MNTLLPDAIDLNLLRRALVIKLRHHGDVLLTSPVFTVLKNHAPHLEIDALVYQDTQEMLTLHPAMQNVFTIDRDWKRKGLGQQIKHELNLLKRLRERHYDLIVHLTEHPRGAWLTRWLAPRYSVAGEYSHRRGALWRSSFSHICRQPATPRHIVEQHLDALRRLGIYPGPDERCVVFVPGHDAEVFIDSLLEQHGLGQKQFIHLHPTSRWSFKTWRDDYYADLINALHEAGEQVVITAAPDEKEMAAVRRITERLIRPAIDFSGQLTLKQLAALTARAKCFVGVDSVPMHIAAAMQTPIVALFGPSSEYVWGPWVAPGILPPATLVYPYTSQVKHRVITSEHSCRPCGLDGCGGGKVSECLTTLPVQRVFEVITQLIKTA
ncbi:MAG: putative lipopolysaccharide heptosyltransferase III [Gammaproteobacteria bacterium]